MSPTEQVWHERLLNLGYLIRRVAESQAWKAAFSRTLKHTDGGQGGKETGGKVLWRLDDEAKCQYGVGKLGFGSDRVFGFALAGKDASNGCPQGAVCGTSHGESS
jgi:hypothetical protein